MKIRPLKELLPERIDDLVEVDRLSAAGVPGLEPWGARHFLMDVAGKWRLSYVALDVAEDEPPARDLWRPAAATASILGFTIGSVARGIDPDIKAQMVAITRNHRLIVRPDARGKGVGQALVQARLQGARELGAWLTVNGIAEENVASQAFYERLGFRRVPGWLIPIFLGGRGAQWTSSDVRGEVALYRNGSAAWKYLYGRDIPPAKPGPQVQQ